MKFIRSALAFWLLYARRMSRTARSFFAGPAWKPYLLFLGAMGVLALMVALPPPKGPQVISYGRATGVGAAITLPSQIKFNQNTTGSASRSLASKLADTVSVKDFGAIGDGVTDDSTAVTNAINAAGPTQVVDFGCPGTYKTTLYGTLACGDYYPPSGATGGFPRSLPQKILDIVDVRDYGAVGNGIADDTTAINNAFAAGGVVLFPLGTYLFTALNTVGSVDLEVVCALGAVLKSNTTGTAIPIDAWSSAKRVNIRGCKFSHAASTPAAFISVKGSKVTLSQLTLSGSSATCGIDNTFAYRTTIEKLTVNGFTGTPICLRQSAADATFSYAISIIDTELSNVTGTGVIIEGGSVNIDNSVIESCSAGGVLVSSNWTTWPLKFSGIYMEANSSYDIKLDSDAATGTRWAHVSIDGGRFVSSPGIKFNGRGYLHMRNVEGVTTPIAITQLNTMTAADSFLWIEGGRNYTVQAGVNFGLIEQAYATGTLTAPKLASSAASGSTGVLLNAGAHLVFNADGDSSAWIDYDNVSSLIFNKRLQVQNTIATTNGFFVSDAAVTATLRGAIANGSGAIGTILNNNVALSTAGAKITSIQNNAVEKSYVDLNGAYGQTGVTFANIATGSTANGTMLYCTDCTIANPCAGGGTGAIAKRLNGVWVCN